MPLPFCQKKQEGYTKNYLLRQVGNGVPGFGRDTLKKYTFFEQFSLLEPCSCSATPRRQISKDGGKKHKMGYKQRYFL